MANTVYRVTEIIGTSKTSWEDAASTAVETAGKSLRDLRVAEVTAFDMTLEGGKVQSFRAKVKLSFKFQPSKTTAKKKKKKVAKKGRK